MPVPVCPALQAECYADPGLQVLGRDGDIAQLFVRRELTRGRTFEGEALEDEAGVEGDPDRGRQPDASTELAGDRGTALRCSAGPWLLGVREDVAGRDAEIDLEDRVDGHSKCDGADGCEARARDDD